MTLSDPCSSRRFRMKPPAATAALAAQASALAAHRLSRQLTTFLAPILRTLDRRLDRRLVGTFLATLLAIVQWRNRPHGLLLSELGGYLLTPEHAPPGTTRLSNLLRSPYWSASLIADWLWQQADTRIQALSAEGEQPLLVWDGSVLEKPETITNPDLCALRSSKARRLKRIRPGFFNPPGGRPICVPGLHWLGCWCLDAPVRPAVPRCSGGPVGVSARATSAPRCAASSSAASPLGAATSGISGIAS